MRIALSLGVALTLLALLPAAAAKEVAIDLRGYRVVLSSRGDLMAPDGDLLVVARAGRARYVLTAPLIEIRYRAAAGAKEGPDLIVTSFSGGAHCCFTVH